MKYINKQKDKNNCGPIAIANALKFKGIKDTSYDQIVIKCNKILKRRKKKEKKQGTDLIQILKVLKNYKIKTKKITPNINKVIKHLIKYGPVIYHFTHTVIYSNDFSYQRKGHWVFIESYDKKTKKFTVFNVYKKTNKNYNKSFQYSKKHLISLDYPSSTHHRYKGWLDHIGIYD